MAAGLPNVTKITEKAAQLLAEDILTDERIAQECGVSRQTLARWKRSPSFMVRVQAIAKAYADRALEHGLARKEKRLTELDEIYWKLKRVISERGASEEMQGVAGGTTGLVCKTYKGIGDNLRPVYEVDNPTIKELRSIHEQYADELGQKISRSEVKITDALGERIKAARERLEARKKKK